MAGRLLDHDASTGITEYYHFNETDQSWGIETVQDITGILDANVRLQNEQTGRYKDLTMIARLPLSVVMDLAKQGIMDMGMRILDEKKYRRWLNDSENQKFRTKLGQV